MEKFITDERTGLCYELVGDYYLIAGEDEPEGRPIGVWGQRHLRYMDNRCALLFIRGEKPVMDEKYDLLRHPNLRRTADGGAAPYVHKAADYACGDIRGAFVSLEELILLEGFTE